MCRVFFISDLHLGHEGALKWAKDYREGNDVHEMNQWMIDQINSVVTKRDLLYILGDVCFDLGAMHYLDQIPCRKRLILGNHDTFPLSLYEEYFEKVQAYHKYKGFWLSHMPLHEHDMVKARVRGNIHGHLHMDVIDDPRYHNVCVEQNHGVPFLLKDLIE